MGVPYDIAEAIVAAGRRMDALGFVPATAGNFSVRLADGCIAITASGRHKGFLTPDDVIAVDTEGAPLQQGHKASAETLLHCGIYRRFPDAGAVLHGHSIANTVLSRRAGNTPLRLAAFELLKAFPGLPTHEAEILLPVVPNDQDIARMQRGLDALWDAMGSVPPGYLIAGHGSYVWAPDMPTALVRMEALDFMLRCELEERRTPA
ncbi:methylthioribulose 1-phosphate dehydratase [Falsiroseomonas sp. HW251]|uniref:methylthioribulose 1-phosphate dehydratase n=1 Tax=Falsiroseomonas sp. HW251 TaxID=3390998 RepID=UPI003D31E628